MKGIPWCDETWNPLAGCGGCEVGSDCWALRYAWRHAHNPRVKGREQYARVVTRECPQCGGARWGIDLGRKNELVTALCPTCRGKGIGPLHWTGDIAYFPERLEDPLHWRKPRRVAVGLMGDMFAEGVKAEYLAEIMDVIEGCSRHTFIILTKRPGNMLKFFDEIAEGPPPNLITGVSITDQQTADERVPILLQVPGRHCNPKEKGERK